MNGLTKNITNPATRHMRTALPKTSRITIRDALQKYNLHLFHQSVSFTIIKKNDIESVHRFKKKH